MSRTDGRVACAVWYLSRDLDLVYLVGFGLRRLVSDSSYLIAIGGCTFPSLDIGHQQHMIIENNTGRTHGLIS